MLIRSVNGIDEIGLIAVVTNETVSPWITEDEFVDLVVQMAIQPDGHRIFFNRQMFATRELFQEFYY